MDDEIADAAYLKLFGSRAKEPAGSWEQQGTSAPRAAGPRIEATVLRRLVTRMQRTHDRRRASFFVGPPGIGKSTAIEAFRAAQPGQVMVTRVVKRGATGPQMLQQLLLALRLRREHVTRYVTNATAEVQRYVDMEIGKACDGLTRDDDPSRFPLLTVVFDEAQRLTNGAIDALRDYNEPHYLCRGAFPLGMIFVGNNELSLQAQSGGASIIDEGMADRLLYRDRLSYDDIEREDIERYAQSLGVTDNGAVRAIVAAFAGPFAQQRSFRRISDLIEELRDEALDGPITRETVKAVLALA